MNFKIWTCVVDDTCEAYRLGKELDVNDWFEACQLAKSLYPKDKIKVSGEDSFSVTFGPESGIEDVEKVVESINKWRDNDRS